MSQSSQSKSFILKMLSGPHQGAEVLLREGEYFIGSDPNCDIILSDSLIAAKHAKLLVQADNISLEALESQSYINGRPINGTVERVPAYDFIALGSTVIVLGPSDETWPPIQLSDAPPIELKKPEETAKEKAGDSTPTRAPTTSPWTVILAVACLLCLSVALLYYYMDTSEDSIEVISDFDIENEIHALIDEFDLGQSIDVLSKNGTYTISGYVRTEQERATLQDALLKLNYKTTFRVYSYDWMLRKAKKIFEELNLSLDLSYKEPSILLVKGYVGERQLWTRAKNIIREDLSMWKEIDDQVLTDESIFPITDPILEKVGLAGIIQLLPFQAFIRVEGVVSEEQYTLWQNTKQKLRAALGAQVAFQENLQAANIKVVIKKYFDFPINSVSVKEPGWISLEDGKKYFTGTTLPSGYTILKINEEGVLLRKGSDEVMLKLDQL